MQVVIDIPIDKLTCNKCPCCNGDEGLCELYYLIHKKYIGSWDILWDDRPKECPVIVLPEHHGDLKDVNDIIKQLDDYLPYVSTMRDYSEFSHMIKNAPTVLEGADNAKH